MEDFEIDIKVDTKALDEALAKMPYKLAGQIVKDSLQAAGLVMLAPMKALCPVRSDTPDGGDSLAPGILRESLTTQVQMKTGYPPRVKVGAPIETTQVARLVEYGFNNVKSKTHIAGHHFMAAAFDESAEAAVNVFIVGLARALEFEANGE